MGDYNEDIQSEVLAEWKGRIGLKDLILENLKDNEDPPSTYQRGSTTIDAILFASGFDVQQAGYLPFGEGVGDHKALFVDVIITSTLGESSSAKESNGKDIEANGP